MNKLKFLSFKSRMNVQSSSSVSNNSCNEFDVVIVGGGLTGLMTGYYILKKHVNLSVLILESKDYVGGLINNKALEFFAHDSQKYITELIQELDLPVERCRKSDDKSRIFWTRDGPICNKKSSIITSQIFYFVKSVDGLSQKYINHLYLKHNKEANYYSNLSVEDYIKFSIISTRAQQICRSFIYATCGIVNLKNVSFLWLLMMYHNTGGFHQRLRLYLANNTKYFIRGGFATLIHKMNEEITAAGGVIKCSETVQSIKVDGSKVSISTSLGIYGCGSIVIAIPPLYSNKVNIELDTLPEIQSTIVKSQSLYYSENTTYFETTLWSPFWFSQYSGNILTDLDKSINLKIAYDVSREQLRKNVLAGFSHQSRNSFNGSINTFRAINLSFRSQKAVNYVDHCEHSGMSFMNVLKPCSFKFHTNPLLDHHHSSRVYFAASEYAKNFPGTADGAIEAGERVACLVLHHVRPQTLNASEMAEFLPKKIPKWSEDTKELDWAHKICLFFSIGVLTTIVNQLYTFHNS